ATDVAGGGDAVGGVRFLGRIGGGQEKGQQAGEPQAVHRWTSRMGEIGMPSEVTRSRRSRASERNQRPIVPEVRRRIEGVARTLRPEGSGVRTVFTRSLEAFDGRRQDDRGGAVAPFHHLDAGDGCYLPGDDGQVADLLPAELERRL